jgi:hypothetical protein
MGRIAGPTYSLIKNLADGCSSYSLSQKQYVMTRLNNLLFNSHDQLPIQKTNVKWVLKKPSSQRGNHDSSSTLDETVKPSGIDIQKSGPIHDESTNSISHLESFEHSNIQRLPSSFVLKSGVVVKLREEEDEKCIARDDSRCQSETSLCSPERISSNVSQFIIYCSWKYNFSDCQVNYINRHDDVDYVLLAVRDCIKHSIMFSPCKFKRTPHVVAKVHNRVTLSDGSNLDLSQAQDLASYEKAGTLVPCRGDHCFSSLDRFHVGWLGYIFPLDKEKVMSARRIRDSNVYFTSKPDCLCTGVTNIAWVPGCYTYIANSSAKMHICKSKPQVSPENSLVQNLDILLR